jgi:hypothetical protein
MAIVTYKRLERTPRRGRKQEQDLTRDEKLWILRTGTEQAHRHSTWLYGVHLVYIPSALDNNLPEMSAQDFRDTCNKSVPVYITGADSRVCLLPILLHNYIYRRWFRPYRSEIDYLQFLCKFIVPQHLLHDSRTTTCATKIDAVVSMNNAICEQVQALPGIFEERNASPAGDPRLTSENRTTFLEERKYYRLQPLFRALLIIADSRTYDNEDSETVGKMPVCLVRTGVEDGLSTPITLESLDNAIDIYPDKPGHAIQVTLETAIDFVMDLEARERAAFGLQRGSLGASEVHPLIKRGWESFFGDEPVPASSSEYVSDERAKEWGWCGSGEEYDSKMAVEYEKRTFRTHELRRAGAFRNK